MTCVIRGERVWGPGAGAVYSIGAMEKIIIFNSTNQALLAEKALEDQGFLIDIVPLPPGLSAECGLAIQFEAADGQAIEALLARRRITYKGIVEG